MINPEQIKRIKQSVRIENYLLSKGIKEKKIMGGNYWYLSPLREEKTASFSVDTKRNTFRDFGNPNYKTTSIIDLVMLMEKVSFPDACKILESIDGEIKKEFGRDNFSLLTVNTLNNCLEGNSSGKIIIEQLRPLQNKSLINYCESRKIPFHLASKYLNEAYFTNDGKYNKDGKPFYALAFKNDEGGFELRSKYFKGGNSPKTITTINVPESKNICVFEGFFDFLSALVFYKTDSPKCTTIILNSKSFLDKAMPKLATAKIIHAYLDLDKNQAGQEATQRIKDAGLNVIDQSKIYKGYNDFNEYLNK